MPRTYGHKVGSKVVEDMLTVVDDLGVKYFTVYAFSTENWNRPDDEVAALMKLLKNYLKDCMPEATKDIIEREVPGIPEAMRAYSMTITPRAMLSRAAAGIRKGTLIVNLPGSPKAVRESLEYIIPALEHGLQILTGEATNCARK